MNPFPPISWIAPSRCAIAMAACVALLAVPPAAHAEAPTQLAVALARFEEGKEAFEQGRFEEALLAFDASLAMQPSPNTRLYIGRCQRALGRIASAYTSLKLASREAQDRITTTGEKRYTATRDVAAGEAAELEPRVPRITLAVPSDLPPGFSVRLNGSEVPRAAWGMAIEVDPGTHEIRAVGRRVYPFVVRIDLAEGAEKRIDIQTTRMPTARLTLHFAAKPAGMAIEIDGKPVDPRRIDRHHDIDVGVHRVVVRAPGYTDFVWQRPLKDGDAARVHVALYPIQAESGERTGTPPWLFFGVAGAGVAATGIGAAFAVQASNMAAEEQEKHPLLRDPAVRDEVGAAATRANVAFGIGGALAVGAGILYFMTGWTHNDTNRTTGANASPWISITPQGNDLGVRGRF